MIEIEDIFIFIFLNPKYVNYFCIFLHNCACDCVELKW